MPDVFLSRKVFYLDNFFIVSYKQEMQESLCKETTNKNKQFILTKTRISYSYLIRSKIAVVYRALLYLLAGSFEITFTVPLIRPCLNNCGFIDDWGFSREWKFPFYIRVHILRILNINNGVRGLNSCIVDIEINA